MALAGGGGGDFGGGPLEAGQRGGEGATGAQSFEHPFESVGAAAGPEAGASAVREFPAGVDPFGTPLENPALSVSGGRPLSEQHIGTVEFRPGGGFDASTRALGADVWSVLATGQAYPSNWQSAVINTVMAPFGWLARLFGGTPYGIPSAAPQAEPGSGGIDFGPVTTAASQAAAAVGVAPGPAAGSGTTGQRDPLAAILDAIGSIWKDTGSGSGGGGVPVQDLPTASYGAGTSILPLLLLAGGAALIVWWLIRRSRGAGDGGNGAPTVADVEGGA